MGYAAASGLPPIYGLYASIIPLIAYAIFGPSRYLVLGPDSALTALIAATILPLAAGNADKAVALAGMLSILTGIACVLAGLARFGFITDLLSKPIRDGYINGIALTVFVGQLPKILGFSVVGGDFLNETYELGRLIWHGYINWVACAIGLSCLFVIVGFRKWGRRIPGVLIAMVSATIVVSLFALSDKANIAVIGQLPRGLPQFQIPAVSFAELRDLCAGAVAIALVAFADMGALSRFYANRTRTEIDSNQELIALGIANAAAGLFQGFPVSSSASRTPVAESAGAKTQVTGVVGAACIAVLLIFAPTLLNDLPQAALGAGVISACISLVEVRGVLRLYRVRRDEFLLSMVCFFGVVLLGVIQGIFIAVTLALSTFIWRAWRPHSAVLGHVDGLKSYHDISRHPEAKRIPGLLIFRWDAPLFFANAEIFREQVLQALGDAPTPTRWVVIAAEPITDVDITAAAVLDALDTALHGAGMDLFFAEMKGPVKDTLKRYGLFNRLGTDNFYPTIDQAVEHYLGVASSLTNREN
jgi:high affinity sulfate transporter 1